MPRMLCCDIYFMSGKVECGKRATLFLVMQCIFAA